MKGIAFLFDPDGYWIELVKREMKDKVDFPSPYNLSQTMIRVKDHQKSLAFYCDVLGMKLADQIKLNSFSLYFLTASEEEARKCSTSASIPINLGQLHQSMAPRSGTNSQPWDRK
eukprot:GHVN01001843.1.p2 GENE.GHVN01001843.1~~GHVN01001843.1.p2  ORF type:complete len:115 (-),score=8.26 GHVN01001843.1:1225-1569(-)